MSWKKKVRRMAAKVAPAKMNTKNKNEDWAVDGNIDKSDWKEWLKSA